MTKIVFAPLQGYTDATFRNLHEKYFGGVSAYYTPFVRLEKGSNFRKRELRDIDPLFNKVSHLIPQLLAGTPDELHIITGLLREKGYHEIDINMGCPFPLIARKGKGAGILSDPDGVRVLLDAVTQYPDLLFSLKMRLGMECVEEMEALLPIINQYPLREVTIHARQGKQQYKGVVDLDGFARFLSQCKHPVVYNGDVCTLNDIRSIETRFPKISGIMIGRGLLANPALALEYAGTLLDQNSKLKKLQLMHDELLETVCNRLQGDAHILAHMKSWWEYLLPDLEKRIRKHILKSNKLITYKDAVREAWDSF